VVKLALYTSVTSTRQGRKASKISVFYAKDSCEEDRGFFDTKI